MSTESTQAPLAGRTLVVTRPLEQADSLCRRIEAGGGRAIRFPVLAIAPAPDTAELEAIGPDLARLAACFGPGAAFDALTTAAGLLDRSPAPL